MSTRAMLKFVSRLYITMSLSSMKFDVLSYVKIVSNANSIKASYTCYLSSWDT